MLRNKKGVSGVITTVLLILLVIAITGVLWVVVQSFISEGTKGIGTDAFTINIGIEEAQVFESGVSQVRVERNSGKGNINALRFVFESESGQTFVAEENQNLPNELEAKTYFFNFIDLEVDKKIRRISVIPLIESGVGRESNKFELEESEGEGAYYNNLVPNWDMDTDVDWLDNPEQVMVMDFEGNQNYAHESVETVHANPSVPECYNWAQTILIPADPTKAYKFSIWIKNDDTTVATYFGFWPYDENMAYVDQPYQGGDWGNPYFKSSRNDIDKWVLWTAYLGPSSRGSATECDSSETNGNDWCMPPNIAYMQMRFGSCYGDGDGTGKSYFMYPKIEEVAPDYE